jgi:8-oxo-dGTP pyrophosphatase MutT (NUDIX family)
MTEVPIRDAATVALLRDGAAGLEVWLLTRVTEMVFAAGMAVFPGGRVDDADADLPFAPGAETAASTRFGCDATEARALIGAAVRETFEEAGVLLSVPTADLSGARTDVEAGRVSFGELLRANGLVVDAGALHPWSRWVTPAGELRRRYDTRFFVGVVPAGVDAQDVTSESSSAGWFGIGEALEQAQRGELGMLPPTIMTLSSLAGFTSVAEAVAAAAERSTDPVHPTVTRGAGGGFVAELPDGTSFTLPQSIFPGGRA